MLSSLYLLDEGRACRLWRAAECNVVSGRCSFVVGGRQDCLEGGCCSEISFMMRISSYSLLHFAKGRSDISSSKMKTIWSSPRSPRQRMNAALKSPPQTNAMHMRDWSQSLFTNCNATLNISAGCSERKRTYHPRWNNTDQPLRETEFWFGKIGNSKNRR